jgi:hypothetical protein
VPQRARSSQCFLKANESAHSNHPKDRRDKPPQSTVFFGARWERGERGRVKTMKKGLRRRVNWSFLAKLPYKEPTTYERFKVGDVLVYEGEGRDHILFTMEGDPEGAVPFLIDPETFKRSTNHVRFFEGRSATVQAFSAFPKPCPPVLTLATPASCEVRTVLNP